MDTVLLIGASGNIGRALLPRLLEVGYRVRTLQHHNKIAPRNGVDVVTGSTLDPGSLCRALEGVDAVCQLVRPSGASIETCDEWFESCVQGTKNLLEAIRRHPVKRLINGGTDNVFGHIVMPHNGPIDETHPKRFADGYYGLFKVVEEAMLQQYQLGFDIPVVISRFPRVWNTERVNHGPMRTIDLDQQRISVQFDCHGKVLVRHDVHVDDAVQGILLCLQADAAVGHDFFFASPAPYASDQLADLFHRKFGWPVEHVLTDWHPWTIDCAKAKSMLGYQPQINLLEWLEDYLNST